MRPPRWFALLVTLALSLQARPAAAQCGAKTSSCSTCHDGTRASAPSAGAWHADHAFADVCAQCHGGNAEAHEIASAHAGLVAPLDPEATRCRSCHADRSVTLAERYRTVDRDAGALAPSQACPTPTDKTWTPPPVHGERGPNLIFLGVVIAVAAGGAIYVHRHERARAVDTT